MMGCSTSTDEWWCVWLKPSACDEADIAADCASTCCRAAAVNATLDSLADDLLSVSVALDTAWKLLCGVLVMLMQLGFAMLEAGTVREHNVIATYAKNIIDVILGTLIAALWGYSVAYGGTWPLAWDEDTTAEDHYSFFVFLAFQSTCATIVSGAMAERTAVGSYLVLSCTVPGVRSDNDEYGLASSIAGSSSSRSPDCCTRWPSSLPTPPAGSSTTSSRASSTLQAAALASQSNKPHHFSMPMTRP